MPVSVIIPSYNRLDALPQTLASLARQTVDLAGLEVIVVDDGSTDGTPAWLDEHHAEFPFVLTWIHQARGGPGAARNRGARAAAHEILLFWDGDMIAGPGAVGVHAALHGQHARALVAGARRPWAEACTSTFSRITVLSGANDHFGDRRPTFLDVLSSNLSISRELFWQLGGFDESLWAYEDLDLAYRAHKGGASLLFSHEAYGHHNHPQTLAQACAHQRSYQAHAAAFLQRHPELRGAIGYLVDKAPADFRHDSPGLLLRKGLRRLIASPPVLRGILAVVHLLERRWPEPRLLAFLYWKVVSSHQTLGFRAGLAGERRSGRTPFVPTAGRGAAHP